MRGLKELMDLEIELNPTLDSDSSKESQLHWQKQYVEYNFKVKQLLGKLLRKLEDNNEYQRYLEDEIKLLECGVPSSIVSDTGNTPPSVINRPSQEFSSIILGAADFISSKARNICPASLSEDMTSEKTESTDVGGYRNSPFQTEETDDDNGSIKYHFSRRQSSENLNKVTHFCFFIFFSSVLNVKFLFRRMQWSQENWKIFAKKILILRQKMLV